MKRGIYIFVAVSILLLVGFLPGSTYGGVRVGIGIGPVWPWWGAPYYPYYYSPYYYSEPPIVIQQQSPLYEQQAPQVKEQQYYWYYCQGSKTYYPYVKQCPGGWIKVVPTPSPPKGKE